MAAKMSLCTISYNYEHYAGIDVENCPTLSMSMSKGVCRFQSAGL